MSYINFLIDSAKRSGNILCLGVDPVVEKMDGIENINDAIELFFVPLLDALKKTGDLPAALKPNVAYFEQYGLEGIRVFSEFMSYAKSYNIPIIMDAKRGDIGATSTAYARAVFDAFGANAVTVAPYMGHDSVLPFVHHAGDERGVYVLCKTSNPGSEDFQTGIYDGTQLSEKVADKIVEWSSEGSLGAVVGATDLVSLSRISKRFSDSGKNIALLIPGVGTQGGTAEETVNALHGNHLIHRINVGSAIMCAHLKMAESTPIEAAIKASKAYAKALSV